MYSVEKFYVYTEIEGGYEVSLTPAFREALDRGQDFEGWITGSPLPNPGNTYHNTPVISMGNMFKNCKALSLDLCDFDTSNLTYAKGMFSGCKSYEIYFKNFRHARHSSTCRRRSGFVGMLDCETVVYDLGWSLPSDAYDLYLSLHLGLSPKEKPVWEETDYYRYNAVPGGYQIALSLKFRQALENNSDFKGWKKGTPLPAPEKTYKGLPVISMHHMFCLLETESLDLSNFDTSNVKSMEFMFWKSRIPNLNLISFNTREVENMSYMFDNFHGTTLDLRNFSTKNAWSKDTEQGMRYMFHRCHADVITGSKDAFALDTSTDFKGKIIPARIRLVWFTTPTGQAPVFPCRASTSKASAVTEEAPYTLYLGLAEVPDDKREATVSHVNNFTQVGYQHAPI